MEKNQKIEVEAFNKALVLHADHELNASTFTARVCVATLSDVYSGITCCNRCFKRTLTWWSKRASNENVN